MKRVKENADFLKAATSAHAKQCKALIQTARKSQLDAICEILLNILRGVIPLKEEVYTKAARVKKALRQIVVKCSNKKLRKELICKYFSVIKKLLSAALPVIGVILSGSQIVNSV